ncbi:hypothetical protein ACHMW6_20965 [Pseudoduganella sp. UC29_106]|uniref:hypothetical protein n=1 Tax=Pseudoduganella sp. UC29_106 TaxID=3374553 RepID=UPI003756C952
MLKSLPTRAVSGLASALAFASSFAATSASAQPASAASPAPAASATAAIPAAVQTTQGALRDGTPYRIDYPERWNGVVLIGLDYASRPPGADATALLAEGYALAGTTRTVTGWAIHRSAANAIETLDLFEAKYGKAKHAVELGQSQGGHTAAVSMQAYPARWAGAVVKCGGLSGSVGQWQAKLDGLFVAKMLIAPQSSLPVTGIAADWQQTALPAWTEALNAAEKTPAGLARIALAARIAQLPEWSDPAKPQPASGDAHARAQGLADSLVRSLLRQAMSSRSEIERLSGGNISSNEGVDYGALLAALDGDGLIASLYREAGLDLADDLARLARAPRLRADPAAKAFVATGVFDGRLAMPVLTLSALGDAISPPASQSFYEGAVGAAGKGALLRQVYTNSAGHCGFTPAETVASVHTLMQRIDSGKWPETNASSMTQAAQATQLGASRFVDYTPPRFQRSYDSCQLLRDLQQAKADPVRLPGQALPACVAPQTAAGR